MFTRISSQQLYIIMFWFPIGCSMLEIPKLLGEFTIRDAWIATAILALGFSIPALIVLMHQRTFPQTEFDDSLGQAFGKYMGKVLTIFLLGWIFVMSIFLLRELTRFVSIELLPETSHPLIASVICIPVGYCVYKGIEVLGRVIEFFTPLLIMILLVLQLAATTNTDYSYLTPVLADGWKPVLTAGTAIILYDSCCAAILLLLVADIQSNVRPSKVLILSCGLAGITSVPAIANLTAVLGPSASYLEYPFLEVVRTIRFGKFIERLDTIFALYEAILVGAALALLIYCMAKLVWKVFRLNSLASTTAPCLLFTWLGSVVLFPNTEYIDHFAVYVLPGFTFVIVIVIPLLGITVFKVRTIFRSR